MLRKYVNLRGKSIACFVPRIHFLAHPEAKRDHLSTQRQDTGSIRRDSVLQLLDAGQTIQKKKTHDVNFDADRLSLYADLIMNLPSEPSKKEKEPRLRLVTRLSTMMRRGRSN